jgi:hypothetical protein
MGKSNKYNSISYNDQSSDITSDYNNSNKTFILGQPKRNKSWLRDDNGHNGNQSRRDED